LALKTIELTMAFSDPTLVVVLLFRSS